PARSVIHPPATFGLELLPQHGRVPTAPARAMMGVYRRYLDLMRAADWQRPAPTMSKWQKLRHGLSAVIAV
ncbi:MAG: hypothetical protein AAF479_12105, partial [Pseudomonadota bacterium]